MSDQHAADAKPTGVSPLRRKISAAVLLVLIVVLLIELRAGAGHSLSGTALQAVSEEGVFENRLLSDVEAMISIVPAKTIVRESVDEVEYRYSWFSLLRPLLQRPKAEFFVVATRHDPPYALLYNTEAPTQESIEAGRRRMESFGQPETDEGFEEPAEDANASRGNPGSRQRQIPQDPTVAILDKDGDGQLNEVEVAAASEMLFAADKNADGKLTADELSGGVPAAASESRRRPPMDNEAAAETTDE